MPRTYHSKGVHTSPEKAGEQNFNDTYVESHQDKSNSGDYTVELWNKCQDSRKLYKGQWTDEAFEEEIQKYFSWCREKKVKPAKVGLALWLGTDKSRIWEWETNPKHGVKHDLIKEACGLIEQTYIGRAESYPTANLFLLETSHGHRKSQSVEIVNKNESNLDEINEQLAKLGLLPKSDNTGE